MGWKTIKFTGLINSVIYENNIGRDLLNHFCTNITTPNGLNVVYGNLKFFNYRIIIGNLTESNDVNLVLRNINDTLDENVNYSYSVILKINSHNSTYDSSTGLYTFTLIYYEDDNYLIIGSLCVCKDYIISINSFSNSTLKTYGYSFVYDISKDIDLVPSDVYSLESISNGKLILYPMVSNTGEIYSNIFDVVSTSTIPAGIYMINGKRYFIASESIYDVTSTSKRCVAFLLDKMK